MTTPTDVDADWALNVPTRRIQADGTAVTVCELSDSATGDVGTVTVTLTADRRLTCTVHGLSLTDFQAWTDQ